MPTQRKTAQSSRKSSSKSTGSKSTSKSRSATSKSRSKSSSSGSSSRSARKSTQGSSRGRSQSQSRSGSKSGSARRSTSSRRNKAPNAIELLTQDHREVQKNFRKAERMDGGDRALQELVETTCAALTLHAEIEEQLFYPALREQARDEDLVMEALVEHDSAKQLIAQLQEMGARDERYKATFKVLGEYVNHHIEEEEGRIFREAKRAKLDMEALGEQILMLKQGGEGAQDDEGSEGE